MKQSLINDYLKALNTLVNDNRVTFAITCNFADHCNIVVYWCKNQVLHNFVLFNDSSTVNYDNLVNDYLAIMAKHPTKQGDKQLFSLRYDNRFLSRLCGGEFSISVIYLQPLFLSRLCGGELENTIEYFKSEFLSRLCGGE